MKAAFDRTNSMFWTIQRLAALLLIAALAAACAPAAVVPQTGAQEVEQAAKAPQPAAASPEQAETNHALLVAYDRAGENATMVVTNLDTGEPVEGFPPVELGHYVNHAFSPDRSQIAVFARGSDCPDGCLITYRLDGLEEVSQVELPLVKYETDWVRKIVFHPDGDKVVISFHSGSKQQIALVDVANGALLRTTVLEAAAREAAFTPDGAQIMILGAAPANDGTSPPGVNEVLKAVLLDAETLETTWEAVIEDLKEGYYGSGDHNDFENTYYYVIGIVVDGDQMYIAHADTDHLTTVNFASRKVTTMAIGEAKTWIERAAEFVLSIGAGTAHAKAGNTFSRMAALSDDGQTLYVVGSRDSMKKIKDGEYEFQHTAIGLEAWDIASGTRTLKLDSEANEVRKAADGTLLLTGYDQDSSQYRPFTEIFDPVKGEFTGVLKATYAFPTASLDGRPVVVSAFTDERGKTLLGALNGGQKRYEWDHAGMYSFFPELR